MGPRRARARRTGALAAVCALAAALQAPSARATEVKVFRAETQSAFLAGTLEGVSVDRLGVLRLADRVERVGGIDEPFVFAAARRGDGWVVGTGNSGRVLAVASDGTVRELFAAPEPEIFAVWTDPDGSVFAGSSPSGKVYRITDAGGEVYFEPGETYIWGLARAGDGSLLVATGTQGKLFRVTSKGKGEVVYDSTDTHLRSLLVLPDNDVVLGTAGEGRILRWRGPGRIETLHDAEPPEIVALAADPEGNVYAAALASESSLVDLTAAAKAAAVKTEDGSVEGATVDVTVEAEAAGGSRPAGAQGPRAVLLRIPPSGIVETAWSFTDETVFALLWHRDRLWVGTGLEGKLYSLAGDALVLEADVDERQIVGLLPDEPGPAFVATNAAAVFRTAAGARRAGTYTSQVLDAGQVARWGTFHWRGEAAAGTDVRFAFRSGLSSEPDDTWSPWTKAREGRELSLAELPAARYLQWRAELGSTSGRSPRLTGAEVSYRQENLRPRLTSFAALEPGQILVPSNFNPANQIYEPVSPDRQGMFTVLRGASEGDDGRLKTLWKKGFRTLRWRATDANEDKLEYHLWFRPEGDEGTWMRVAEALDETFYSFDATALPDGAYRFRVVASDLPGNQDLGGLESEQVSETVLVDHTPPRVESVRREGDRLEVVVRDALNPLRVAEVSVDAGEWQRVATRDGLVDGRSETLLVPVPRSARLVLLRVADAAFNTATVDLVDGGRETP